MAEAAADLQRFLRQEDGHTPDWREFLKARQEQTKGARVEVALPHGGTFRAADAKTPPLSRDEPWAETLARVLGAADLLVFQQQQIAELNRRNAELRQATNEAIEAFQRHLEAAERRADQAERERAAAEDWLTRIHAAIVELAPASSEQR